MCIAAALCGCAPASRLIQPDAASKPVALDLRFAVPGEVTVTIGHVITRDGQGSWVKEAAWEEYLVHLVNEGETSVTLHDLELASVLPDPSYHSTSLTELERDADANRRILQRLGWGVGAPVAATAVVGTVAGTAGAYASMAATVIALPIAVVGGGVYLYRRSARDREDRQLIEAQLAQTGFVTPAVLQPRADLRRSAFFPATPDPTQLILRYEREGVGINLILDVKRMEWELKRSGFPLERAERRRSLTHPGYSP